MADPKIHATTDTFACSFCGKARTEVAKLCADRASFICDECVALCCAVLAEQLPGDQRFAMLVPVRIASDTADSLNRWAAATLDETTPEPRRREEARSYAVEVLVRLARDNPELVPEYTAELARREAARKEAR